MRYKYLIEMMVMDDELKPISGSDRIMICNNRQQCVSECQKFIENQLKSYKKCTPTITHDKYNMTDYGTVIGFKQINKNGEIIKWFWEFNFYPVPVYQNKIEKYVDKFISNISNWLHYIRLRFLA